MVDFVPLDPCIAESAFEILLPGDGFSVDSGPPPEEGDSDLLREAREALSAIREVRK